MFAGLIQNPVPEDVDHIEGVGDLWQGYNIWLRFHASKRFINTLISKGYHRTSWKEIARHFELPKDRAYHLFTPAWSPNLIPNKKCFQGLIRCPWSQQHQGHHFLVIDESTGTIYFYGWG
jgi:hypothetical protein